MPSPDDAPRRRFPAVTTALVLVDGAAFIFELTLPRYGLTLQGFHAKVGVVPFELAHGYDVPPADLVPWWATVATALFLSGGWARFVLATLYLWVFGADAEDRLGGLRFLALYLACGAAATAAQVTLSAGSTVPVVGAGGAIAGLLGAFLVLSRETRGPVVLVPGAGLAVVPAPVWVLPAVWFGLQVLLAVLAAGPAQTVAAILAAQAVGFAAGLVLAVPLDRWGRRPRGAPRLRRTRSV